MARHDLRVDNDPSEDPAHAKEWKQAKQKRGGQVIDLLVHLER